MWKIDRDGWYTRSARAGETTKLIDPTGCHAFVDGGRVYCRDQKQENRIDRGLTAVSTKYGKDADCDAPSLCSQIKS